MAFMNGKNLSHTWNQTDYLQRQETFHNDSKHTFNVEKKEVKRHAQAYIYIYANIVKMLKTAHHSDMTGRAYSCTFDWWNVAES